MRKVRNSHARAIIQQARGVLEIEAQGIFNLLDKIGEDFVRAVECVLNLKGRVIVTGIGKSGIVARKLAATLNSTGTPALFLHPAEALHGDLGMVTPEDMVLAISNSGETRELNLLIPSLKRMHTKLIAFTGNINSTLAQNSDMIIDVGVQKEACPLGLAPTASTTAALAMGDALAVALVDRRKFDHQDFRRYHPGGKLGLKSSLKIKEVMLTGESIPIVNEGSRVGRAIDVMNEKNLESTLVVRKNGVLIGIITDSNLRKALKKYNNIHELKVNDVMEVDLKTIDEDHLVSEALEFMWRHRITVLPIVGKSGRVRGIMHLHSLLERRDLKLIL